jgi:hypothetical protein
MLEIELAQSDDKEAQFAARVLQDLATQYDLRPFLFTHLVRLDRTLGRGGMSHPVLSLGVMYANDPDRFLSVFLHEQMHWFLCACDLDAVDAGRSTSFAWVGGMPLTPQGLMRWEQMSTRPIFILR